MHDLFPYFVNLYIIPGLQDGTIDKNSVHARLRLTIPREPDLETANRAQRIRFVVAILMSVYKFLSHRLLGSFVNLYIRPKVIAEQENISATAHRFKARPLNRKVCT